MAGNALMSLVMEAPVLGRLSPYIAPRFRHADVAPSTFRQAHVTCRSALLLLLLLLPRLHVLHLLQNKETVKLAESTNTCAGFTTSTNTCAGFTTSPPCSVYLSACLFASFHLCVWSALAQSSQRKKYSLMSM